MSRLIVAALLLGLLILLGCGCDRAMPVAKPKGSQRSTSRPPKTPASEEDSEPMMIQLATGVALAQTLPDGTMMGFSVDYHFVGGMPSRKAKYFWVIQRGDKEAVKIETPLQFRGNLTTFVPWRPEDGPFRSHLEDANGAKLSKSIKMK